MLVTEPVKERVVVKLVMGQAAVDKSGMVAA